MRELIGLWREELHPLWVARCRRIAGTLLPLAMLSGGPVDAVAHDERVSASEVRVSAHELVWTVDVGLIGLAKTVDLQANPVEITEAQLERVAGKIGAYLGKGLSVEINGRQFAPENGGLEPVYEPFLLTGEPYIGRVHQVFRFRSETGIERVRLGVMFFADLTREHRAVLRVQWLDRSRQFVRTGPSHVEMSYGGLNPSFWSTASEFLSWGAHHIFVGYDHIAFLLALLIAARRLRQMVVIVTSFTLAHSITLLLSALDVIRLEQALTEALIAASIVYISLENCFLREARFRWLLTFVFGLVHGLGFSSVLRERLNDVSGVWTPVLSFNLGVEMGQLLILGLVFPLLLRLRRAATDSQRERRQRLLVWAGSAPIFLLGAGWLVERLFRVGFMPL